MSMVSGVCSDILGRRSRLIEDKDIIGFEDLSEDEKAELHRKVKKVITHGKPLDPILVSRTLDKFAEFQRTGNPELAWLGGNPEDREFREEGTAKWVHDAHVNIVYEEFCFKELLRLGGRPATSFQRLLSARQNKGAVEDAFQPWDAVADYLDDPLWPPVFETQLDDWRAFRYKWQLYNRGDVNDDKVFDAFYDTERRWSEESMPRVDWSLGGEQHELDRECWTPGRIELESSGKKGFEAYALAVKTRLAFHHFTQSFELAEDPDEQDAWTTWVEYLSYIYFHQDKHSVELEKTELAFQSAWEALKPFGDKTTLEWHRPSGDGHDDCARTRRQLNVFREDLQAIKRQFKEFHTESKDYHYHAKRYRHMRKRAEWALEQLHLIATGQPAVPDVDNTDKGATTEGPSCIQRLRIDGTVLWDYDEDVTTPPASIIEYERRYGPPYVPPQMAPELNQDSPDKQARHERASSSPAATTATPSSVPRRSARLRARGSVGCGRSLSEGNTASTYSEVSSVGKSLSEAPRGRKRKATEQ